MGLDRGQLGPPRVVAFRLVGNKVLLEERNLDYRASLKDEHAQRAASESFATSILWAGNVLERSRGAVVFDASSLAIRDAHGSAQTLAETGQGEFALDVSRSVLDSAGCVALPDNVELSAILTFANAAPGALVQSTTPSPNSVTLLQHQSFIRLPDERYKPRAWDPRSGSFSRTYLDTAAGVDEPNVRRLASRFRLVKKNRAGEVVKPIIYYVDRGAPEPIRSALMTARVGGLARSKRPGSAERIASSYFPKTYIRSMFATT